MSPKPLFILCACVLLALGGCETSSRSGADAEWRPFTGTVVWVPENRGYWALTVDHVGRINPMELPTTVHEDGTRVSGEMIRRPDYHSAKRWGTVAEVRNVQRIE